MSPPASHSLEPSTVTSASATAPPVIDSAVATLNWRAPRRWPSAVAQRDVAAGDVVTGRCPFQADGDRTDVRAAYSRIEGRHRRPFDDFADATASPSSPSV